MCVCMCVCVLWVCVYACVYLGVGISHVFLCVADGARSELDIVAQLQAQLKGQIKDTYAKIQQRTEDLVPEADADL
eukprot:m.990469 g.990469  ORF g.990469 m.990469 type:complete len:76 (+) comp24000_c1_seq34:3108-3335(+)